MLSSHGRSKVEPKHASKHKHKYGRKHQSHSRPSPPPSSSFNASVLQRARPAAHPRCLQVGHNGLYTHSARHFGKELWPIPYTSFTGFSDNEGSVPFMVKDSQGTAIVHVGSVETIILSTLVSECTKCVSLLVLLWVVCCGLSASAILFFTGNIHCYTSGTQSVL